MGQTRRRRWIFRIARFLVYAYVAVILFFMFFSRWLIFQGLRTQGSAAARVTAPAGMEMLHLQTADGIPITGLFAPSAGGDVAHSPTVIYFYANAWCLANSVDMLDTLRSMGANAISADYPGYGMSGGSASEKNCYATADAICKYLDSRADIDPTRIYAMGYSLGSGVSVDLASRRKLAGLILISPFNSIHGVARNLFPILPTSLMVRQQFDNLSKIPAVGCPILIYHGRQDSLVPCDMSRQLELAAKSPCKRIVFEDCGHNDIWEDDGDKIMSGVGEFLRVRR